MFQPSGACEIATTVAPARASASGATYDAAPFAQSTTIFSPSKRVATDVIKCSMYFSFAPSSLIARPTPRPVGRSHGSPMRASISASIESSSLPPPRANNLIPLSGIALCEAEIITPRSAFVAATRYEIAGVGRTPTR